MDFGVISMTMKKVITPDLQQFFRENGYVIIKNAVPYKQCKDLVEVIWTMMGKSAEDPEGWYTPPAGMDTFWDHQNGGMIPLYHHQAMWNNRQYPKVYQAFAELLNEEKLWVSMDRVNMKPPRREGHQELTNNFIHWDVDTTGITFPLSRPLEVQGVLYLEDTAENQGGFQCVPELYRNFEEWVRCQPEDRHPTRPDLTGLKVESIPGEAGDLLIWDVYLAHGNGDNRAEFPRLAQYIRMFPAQPNSQQLRQGLIDCWQHNADIPGFSADPRQWERTQYTGPAELTELGRMLLGVDDWFSGQ